MFHELRILIEVTANKPSVPGILRNVLMSIVNFTLKLAPPAVAAPQQQQQQ